jgi:hypothetical protein
MKKTNKQIKALKIIEWFIPEWIKDWNKVSRNDSLIGITDVIESKDGIEAEEAFFMKTEKGKLPTKVKNKSRLRALLWGQKWTATQIGLWKEGLNNEESYPRIYDFKDEPDYIKEFVLPRLFNQESIKFFNQLIKI